MQHDWSTTPTRSRQGASRMDHRTCMSGDFIAGTAKSAARRLALRASICAYVLWDIGGAMSGAGLCPDAASKSGKAAMSQDIVLRPTTL